MVERNELDQVIANTELADRLMATARQHIASAKLLASSDPYLGYAAIYDAIRRPAHAAIGSPAWSVWSVLTICDQIWARCQILHGRHAAARRGARHRAGADGRTLVHGTQAGAGWGAASSPPPFAF
jgi:hypothetical protein